MRLMTFRFFVAVFAASLLFRAAQAKSGYEPDTGKIYSARWNNGVPLGGLGCGKVDLLTDGALGNLTINHNWDRRTALLVGSFAAIHAENGEQKGARVLRLDPSRVASPGGTVDRAHNVSLGNPTSDREYTNVANIAETEYAGAYPVARIQFTDSHLPVQVSLRAFSPMIPQDVKNSSLPVAIFAYTLKNPGAAEAKVTLLFSWQNMLGYGGSRKEKWEDFAANSSETLDVAGMKGIVFRNANHWDGKRENTVGEYYLGAVQSANVDVSTILDWDAAGETMAFWDEFAKTGRVAAASTANPKQPASALLQHVTLAPGEERTIEFVLAWHMPVCRTEYVERKPAEDLELQADNSVVKAFDEKPDTVWTTGRAQIAGDRVTFDFGSSLKLAMLELSSKRSPHNYPWGYRLDRSVDGKKWSMMMNAEYGSAEKDQFDGVLTLRFAPVDARYLRVTTTTTSADRAWSIDEMTAEISDGGVTSNTKPTSATVELIQTTSTTITEDISHYYVNSFASAEAVAAYACEHRSELLAASEAWQRPILDSTLPQWLKTSLVNSLFVFSSNSVLAKDGRFTMQESPVSMAGALGTMDQRLAAHAATLMLFPDLDARELDLFGACQDLVQPRADGRITHFTGNIQETVGNPNVFGGVRNWPDLSSSYIMQVLKHYRWTGDAAFLGEHAPRARRAMAWLISSDRDGDQLPEGGSTFDYEPNTPGAFVYSASVYLGALRASEELARVAGDPRESAYYAGQLERGRASMMRDFWNGRYFIKWNDPRHSRRNENSFVAALAGDWHTRLSGLEPLLPAGIEDTAIDAILARHVAAFHPVPPMEVTPDGRAAVEACYIMQEIPYVGCEAISRGRVPQGLEVLQRVHDIAYTINRDAWSQPLWVDVGTGSRYGLVSYMTAPTCWFVLPALAGASLNVPEHTLDLNPQSIDGGIMRVPLYFPRFWATLETDFAKKRATLTITRTFGKEPLRLDRLRVGPNRRVVELKQPFMALTDARLEVEL